MRLVKRLKAMDLRFVTAESLTAGLIAATVARIPGASSALWGGLICYDSEAKTRLLGVDARIIDEYGVVSPETARAMALGSVRVSGADIGIAVTGVAGPGRSANDPPIGTVDMALAIRNDSGSIVVEDRRIFLKGGRNRVRNRTVFAALEWLNDCLDRY